MRHQLHLRKEIFFPSIGNFQNGFSSIQKNWQYLLMLISVLAFSHFSARGVSCIPPPPAAECTPPTIWNVDVVATGNVDWQNLTGIVADNVNQKIRITGTGTVTVNNKNLILKTSNAVVFIDGPTLILNNGNLQLDASGSRYIQHGGVLRTYGNFQQTTNSVVCIIGTVVDIGEEQAGENFVHGASSTSANFQNDGGYRYLEDVCMNVTHDFQLQSTGSGTGLNGVDVIINSCIETGDRGLNHATPTNFGVSDGDDSGNWQNSNNQSIYGTDIAVANGNFQTSNNRLLLCDVGVKVNKSGNFQVNSGTLAGENLCAAVEDVFENNGTWTLTGITWFSDKQNSTNVPGAGAETAKATILANCFTFCCVVDTCICIAPSNLTVDSISAAEARLCWDAVSCASEYIVAWRVQPKSQWQYAIVIAPEHCRIFTNQFDDVFEIRIATVCLNGDTSDFGPIFTFETFASCLPPQDPYTDGITSTKATLHWSSVSDATKYTVWYRKTGESTWIKKSVSAPNTSLTIKSLLPSTDYEWKVRSKCIGATRTVEGEFTALQHFTTSASRLEQLAETIPTSVFLYPNPASDQVVIAVEADENTTKTMSVEIVNMVGQVIYATQPEAFDGSLKKQIDLSGIANGLYTTRVTIDGEKFFSQLLIQH